LQTHPAFFPLQLEGALRYLNASLWLSQNVLLLVPESLKFEGQEIKT
jgi:hypothetical protein